jgi:hypothetical protein
MRPRSYFPSAVVTLLLPLAAGGADAQDRGTDDGQRDHGLRPQQVYNPGAQTYSRAGNVLAPSPDAPVGRPPDVVWDNAVNQSTAYQNKWFSACDPVPPCCIHFYLDGGVYLFKPHLESNPAFRVVHLPGSGLSPGAAGVVEIGYEPQFAPRLTFGVETDCGIGLRTNWWHFADDSPNFTAFNNDRTGRTTVSTPPILGVPGFTSPGTVARGFGVFNDAMFFSTSMNIHVWDWEVTERFHPGGCWDVLFAEGVRYAYLSQNYEAVRNNVGVGRFGTSRINLFRDLEIVRTGRNLDGVGPTAAVEVRRSLGDTGLSLYGLGRASLICGRGRTRSFQGANVNLQVVPVRGRAVTVTNTALRNASIGHDDVDPITELEFGVEWGCHVSHARVFLRTGVVYQEWFFAGSGSSEQGDLSFFGLNATAGVTF